jgi:putative nucleotidyltransferase with HDIG domain
MQAIIQVLESTIGVRDPYTVAHQQRTTKLACAIATEMDLPEANLNDLQVAGRLHDLGKIAIPTEILSKPGKLTDAEFSLIKSHSQVAYDILQPLKFPGKVAQIILQHHERPDGSGYPLGLKGNEILLEAKILAVADVVESMCSHRPYRPALGLDQALAEISLQKGTLYDAAVVDACLRVYENDPVLQPQVVAGVAGRPQRVQRLAPSRIKGDLNGQPRHIQVGSFLPRADFLYKSRFYLQAAVSSVVASLLMLAIRGA